MSKRPVVPSGAETVMTPSVIGAPGPSSGVSQASHFSGKRSESCASRVWSSSALVGGDLSKRFVSEISLFRISRNIAFFETGRKVCSYFVSKWTVYDTKRLLLPAPVHLPIGHYAFAPAGIPPDAACACLLKSLVHVCQNCLHNQCVCDMLSA